MTVVVSDTSPIRALHHLKLLPLLEEFFDHVLIPPAVNNELHSPLRTLETIDVSIYDFIEVRSPQDRGKVAQFLHTLDRGESEALALALEVDAQIILMDELKGRRIAEHHGIVALGALGVLLRAKSRGRIAAIRPLIERLGEIDFFIKEKLKNDVLGLAGEL